MKTERHDTWWNSNLADPHQLETFQKWVGDHTALSKRLSRRHVQRCGYQSVLDCGCGMCSEFDGYQVDQYPIAYSGHDSCTHLVEMARQRGVAVTHGSVEKLPHPDASIDVVFCRHVLEHLETYRACLGEMLRVARYEVLVVFFIKPHDGPTECASPYETATMGFFNNRYNRPEIESLLASDARVGSWYWEHVDGQECVLHVCLKTNKPDVVERQSAAKLLGLQEAVQRLGEMCTTAHILKLEREGDPDNVEKLKDQVGRLQAEIEALRKTRTYRLAARCIAIKQRAVRFFGGDKRLAASHAA